MSMVAPLEHLASPHGSPLIHRDLSWLQFNQRVLAEAEDESIPLLERAKFLAITSSNLDEFFMIRFASLNRSIATHARSGHEDLVLQLQTIRAALLREIKALNARQSQVLEGLAAELRPHGIEIVLPGNTDPQIAELGKSLFQERILGECSAPTPFQLRKITALGNLQMAAIFPNRQWAPLPRTLSPCYWTRCPDGRIGIFFMDHLISQHLGSAFGMTEMPLLIRLTRDGDLTWDLEEEDTESILQIVKSELPTRDRGRSVRLQYSGAFDEKFIQQGAMLLKLDPNRILPAPTTLCLHGLISAINGIQKNAEPKPELSYPAVPALVPGPFQKKDQFFETLKRKDLLLHHPYDSFDAFVGFIDQACRDPQVTSIEMTAYRTDSLSPIIHSLKECARKKRVRVVIELRARFDEANNLRLAEELREAGAEVAFGFGKLKLHAKLALITRIEDNEPRYYTHLSTGNYNAVTARLYTDLSILTAHPEIGADARLFFDAVSNCQVPTSFKRLVHAPSRLHRRMLSHIETETKAAREGKKARIVAKVNALVDQTIIEALYRASQAGVQVDLIVRSACSLVPGVPGLSENIRVVSIVDRFLEHSRIYYFENSAAMYISSADWMPRNFFSRLELAYPVLDARIFNFIRDVLLPTYLSDTAKARELTSTGEWRERSPGAGESIRCQLAFQELAERNYKDTPLS